MNNVFQLHLQLLRFARAVSVSVAFVAIIVTMAITVAITVAITTSPAMASGDDSAPVAAAESLAPFKRALKQALMEGMEQGPVAAVSVCNVKAPAIAVESSRAGTKVGRASHKLRNPANEAPDWVKPILDAYVANPGDHAPRKVALAGGRAGYVEPILIQPLCLTCHGSALAPDVAARIAELYPQDQAVGFELDDLRGVWWIEAPAAH